MTRALLIAVDASSSRQTVDFAAGREGLFASVAIDPNSIHDVAEGDWEQVVALAQDEKVVAIGETGLDLYWKKSPLDLQLAWFEKHVELALVRDLPLVLHIRDAFPEARDLLSRYAGRGLRAVLHCFGGQAEDIHPFVEWGFMVSFAGNLTYPSAGALREAARATPLAQCLIETDAPWLAPVPQRGKTNEPAFLVHTARELAEIKQLDYEQLAEVTTANACRFFRFESSR